MVLPETLRTFAATVNRVSEPWSMLDLLGDAEGAGGITDAVADGIAVVGAGLGLAHAERPIARTARSPRVTKRRVGRIVRGVLTGTSGREFTGSGGSVREVSAQIPPRCDGVVRGSTRRTRRGRPDC